MRRGSDQFDLGAGDEIFYFPGDLLRCFEIHIGFTHQGVNNSVLPIPAQKIASSEVRTKRAISVVSTSFFERLMILFHLDYDCHLTRPFILQLKGKKIFRKTRKYWCNREISTTRYCGLSKPSLWKKYFSRFFHDFGSNSERLTPAIFFFIIG